MLRGNLFLSLILLIVLIHPAFALTSTLHGTTYEWSTFEPLKNTIVEINSTPPQTFVATDGDYSFELTTGTYQITANYYADNILLYTASENITIESEGVFVLDLLLLPSIELEDELLKEDIEFNETLAIPNNNMQPDYTRIILLVIILLLIALGIVQWKKTQEKAEKTNSKSTVLQITPKTANSEHNNDKGEKLEDAAEETDSYSLTPDLSRVVDIISKNGGRITQKDLRTNLDYSEAKVSLMISELESHGIIEKIKKGRGNIIILKK